MLMFLRTWKWETGLQTHLKTKDMHNRYYTVQASDINIDQIIKVCVGDLESQRKSLDGSLMIVKIKEGDHTVYPFLDPYIELDDDKAFNLMQTAEWQKPIE